MLTMEEKVDRLVGDVGDIKIALKGYNGKKGLCQDFSEHCENDVKFRKDYYKFKRNILIVSAFVLGSGALGIGAVKFASVIFGG